MEKATKPRASQKGSAKAAAPTRRAAAPTKARPKAATPKPKAPPHKPRSKAKDPTLPEPLGYLIAHEEISLRAYHLSQERQQHGTPGDPAQDWLTAEHQLLEEHRAKGSNGNGRV